MNQEIVKRAEQVIASKANYVAGDGVDAGMYGYVTLSLIDENGYPTSSTLTIARADGINWITFATSMDSNKAMRAAKCNRASVCLASSEYNISLVGKIEVVDNPECKKASWCDVMDGGPHWSGYDDPNFCVLCFTTERYNLYFADDDSVAVGTLSEPEGANCEKQKIVPIMCYSGQANQAMELYVKAFGAKVLEKLTYADMHPADLGEKLKGEHRDYIAYSEILIGNQTLSLGDDSDAAENRKEVSGNSYLVDLLVHFDSDKELKAAYELLSDGGTITVPLMSQTYCSLTCALIDKFGGRWQLMSGYEG